MLPRSSAQLEPAESCSVWIHSASRKSQTLTMLLLSLLASSGPSMESMTTFASWPRSSRSRTPSDHANVAAAAIGVLVAAGAEAMTSPASSRAMVRVFSRRRALRSCFCAALPSRLLSSSAGHANSSSAPRNATNIYKYYMRIAGRRSATKPPLFGRALRAVTTYLYSSRVRYCRKSRPDGF